MSLTHGSILGAACCGAVQMLQHCKQRFKVQFRYYDQSSKCMYPSDSSVSYASATVVAAETP